MEEDTAINEDGGGGGSDPSSSKRKREEEEGDDHEEEGNGLFKSPVKRGGGLGVFRGCGDLASPLPLLYPPTPSPGPSPRTPGTPYTLPPPTPGSVSAYYSMAPMSVGPSSVASVQSQDFYADELLSTPGFNCNVPTPQREICDTGGESLFGMIDQDLEQAEANDEEESSISNDLNNGLSSSGVTDPNSNDQTQGQEMLPSPPPPAELIEAIREEPFFIWHDVKFPEAVFRKAYQEKSLSACANILFLGIFTDAELKYTSVSGRIKNKKGDGLAQDQDNTDDRRMDPIRLLAIERLCAYIRGCILLKKDVDQSIPTDNMFKEDLSYILTDKEASDLEKVFVNSRNQKNQQNGSNVSANDISRANINQDDLPVCTILKAGGEPVVIGRREWSALFRLRDEVKIARRLLEIVLTKEEIRTCSLSGRGSRTTRISKERLVIICDLIQRMKDYRYRYPYEVFQVNEGDAEIVARATQLEHLGEDSIYKTIRQRVFVDHWNQLTKALEKEERRRRKEQQNAEERRREVEEQERQRRHQLEPNEGGVQALPIEQQPEYLNLREELEEAYLVYLITTSAPEGTQ